MSNLFWLTDQQMERLQPLSAKSRGRARVYYRRVLSRIIRVKRNRLRWRDAPAAYESPKTLYSRWTLMGVFARLLMGLVAQGQQTETVMIDATHLRAHRTAGEPAHPKGALATSVAV